MSEVVRRASHPPQVSPEGSHVPLFVSAALGLSLAFLPTSQTLLLGGPPHSPSLCGLPRVRDDHPAKAGKGQNLPPLQQPVSSTRPLMNPKESIAMSAETHSVPRRSRGQQPDAVLYSDPETEEQCEDRWQRHGSPEVSSPPSPLPPFLPVSVSHTLCSQEESSDNRKSGGTS